MLLRRLIDVLPNATVSGSVDIDVLDIVYDSRAVTSGALFVAVPAVGGDAQSGGLQFVEDAVRRGAGAVVIQSTADIANTTSIHVPDGRAALADLSAEFFGHPSQELQLYAVTGTDGKTTTSFLLDHVLSSAGYRTGLIGTVEIRIGDTRRRNLDRMTTPESADVQRLLRAMVDANVSHAVLEASSHALALERLRGCTFAACGVTNITADHVEFHGSWERYFQTKASLFTDLGRGKPAILNRDDDHFHRLLDMIVGPIVTYGLSAGSQVRAVNPSPTERGSRFELQAFGERAEVCLGLPGRFNISNALAAAAFGLQAGVRLDRIAAALSQAEPPPGRMERVNVGQPFEVIVDYAHTMNAFQSVLEATREQTPAGSRVIAVFGATGNRDRAKRPVLARLARELTDFFIITNEDPYGEQPDAIIAEVASGVPPDEEGVRFIREGDRARAIREAVSRACPGDTVVILGKGHEQSIVLNGRKEPWSDVAAARDALQLLG